MNEEKKVVTTSNSFAPMPRNPQKEDIKRQMAKIIEETHRNHKGKPGQYRINVFNNDAMKKLFTEEELVEMGITAREMPDIKEK